MTASEQRRHPDLFTPDGAMAYLNLTDRAQLDYVRREHGLKGHRLGTEYQYHRQELDRVVAKIFDVQEKKR